MLAALSIDLDGLEHYHRIHGLLPPDDGAAGERPAAACDPVYGKAIDRFAELCDRLGVRGTAFCIGRSLADEAAANGVRRLALAGHEIANHSLSHDYALTRRPPSEIAAEVRGGAEAILRVTGKPPVGFRAPGYTLSAPLLAALAADGYRYDSSAFPSLPYYLGKSAVMAALAVAGHPSRAILDRPRVLTAPRAPYRPSAADPYARGRVPILELPITTGFLGFPLTGTFLATLPRWVVASATLGTRSLPLFNLELHGIDLLDASDASPALASRQRDLLVPSSEKIGRLETFVRRLGERTWLPLADAAQRLALEAGAGGRRDRAPRA